LTNFFLLIYLANGLKDSLTRVQQKIKTYIHQIFQC